MSEKKIWSIDRPYLDTFVDCAGNKQCQIQFDPIATIFATEEEIKKSLDLEWNKPSIQDPMDPGTVYRPIEATELNIGGVEELDILLQNYKVFFM